MENYNTKAVLSHKKNRADIDGLRAIAVLSVIGYHAFPMWIRGGFVGVDIFFVISGFLISSIIFENIERCNFKFIEFYARRVKRIFPALIVVLMSCFVFGWFALLSDEYKQFGKHMAGGASFISNFILWNESSYFDNLSETKPLLHLWSLGIEEQFYIIWPLLLWGAWKKKLNWLIVIIIIAALSFVFNLLYLHKNSVAAFYSPQTRFWELLIGAMLAYIFQNKTHIITSKNEKSNRSLSLESYGLLSLVSNNSLRNVISLLGFLFVIVSVAFITNKRHFPGTWALLPTLGAAFIISAGSQAWFNKKFLSNRILVWFGLISFPLYLWHWPLLSFARIVESETPVFAIRLLAVLASILLAWLTYVFVEKPIRFGVLSDIKGITISLPILLIMVGFLGYITNANDGFEFRGKITKYANNKNELIRTKPIDDDCLNYIKNRNPSFPYCRFTKGVGKGTVAVIGDSHAHVAYPGIAEILKNRGVSSVLLANSGCPPFIGAEYGSNEYDKKSCKNKIGNIIKMVVSKKDIKQVIIFSRGAVYITGKEYGEAEIGANDGPLINEKIFERSLQNTINTLRNAGKDVYYVTENPELPISPNACIPRPFRMNKKSCKIELKVVQSRQKGYLQIIQKLKNVTIIEVLNKFCHLGHCDALKKGVLLYADADHLSVAGSRFQASNILNNYLKKNDFHDEKG